MSATLSTLALLFALAPAEVPGPASKGAGIDPVLPEALRDVVAEASKAELDPKRGTNNAVEILKAKKAEVPKGSPLALALDLRIAATTLRGRFLTSTEFEVPRRTEQALSTYSRLDATEPGLSTWLERTLDQFPAVKKGLGGKGPRVLKLAVLTRGASLDRQAVVGAFSAVLAKAGVKLEVVPAKEASLVITVGAEDARRDVDQARAVKVTFGAESIVAGKVAWRHGLFRVEAADDPTTALKAGLDWVARIGARDLMFRWLGENGLPNLLDPSPQRPGADHDHGHGHGPMRGPKAK